MDLPYINQGEKSKSDGALHMACFDDPSSSSNKNSATMNTEAEIGVYFPGTEMLDGMTFKKKKKKKKKGNFTKCLNNSTIDALGPGKYYLDSAVSVETTSNHATNYEKGLENGPSAGVNPHFTTCTSGKKLPECSNFRIPVLTENHGNSESSICSECSKFSKQKPEVSSNSFMENLQDNPSPRLLSQCKSYKSMNCKSYKVRDCIGCTSGYTKTCSLCLTAQNLGGITPANDFKSTGWASQSDLVHKTNRQFSVPIGKDNNYSYWKKNKKNANGAQTYRKKQSNFYVKRDVSLLEKNIWVQCNPFPSRGLLPTPLIFPPGCCNSSHGPNQMVNKELVMHSKLHGRVILDPSQWVIQESLNGGFHKHVSCLSELGALETGRGKSKSHNSVKNENYNNRKKGQEGDGGEFFTLHDKSVLLQKESHFPGELYQYKDGNAAQRAMRNSQFALSDGSYFLNSFPAIQQNLPHLTSFSISGEPVQKDFDRCSCTRIPRTEDSVSRICSASVHTGMCSQLKFHNQDKYRKNGANRKKWIPVGRKASGLLKQTSSAGKSQISENSIAGVDVKRVESTKDSPTFGKKTDLNPRCLIGSSKAAKALKSAYQMQLVLEGIHHVIGYPLAEIERFTQSAAPVICSSCVHYKCDVCADNQQSHGLLCKHQMPNVSLRSVWNWYEKPGNYGLEVNAEDSQNSKGLHKDSTCFRAHFVPFLSAVQLFGYQHLPKYSGQSREYTNLELQGKGEVGRQFASTKSLFVERYSEAVEANSNPEQDVESLENFDFVEGPVSSSKVSPLNESGNLCLDTLPAFNESELVFEFFESDLPQHRKPLLDKIGELIDVGTSSHQVYGDPSKLEFMNLHELHPASWFSVAWYPIYRIPEGNFRAAFLTFHSLGHLVQRRFLSDSLNENLFYIVSPVLGLQTYNTKGEGWFNPKLPVETTLKESTSSNGSEILKERRRTLEENALLLARGCIRKNNVITFNRQPDYEFFFSRKI